LSLYGLEPLLPCGEPSTSRTHTHTHTHTNTHILCSCRPLQVILLLVTSSLTHRKRLQLRPALEYPRVVTRATPLLPRLTSSVGYRATTCEAGRLPKALVSLVVLHHLYPLADRWLRAGIGPLFVVLVRDTSAFSFDPNLLQG
jgi:hypothetical protein